MTDTFDSGYVDGKNGIVGSNSSILNSAASSTSNQLGTGGKGGQVGRVFDAEDSMWEDSEMEETKKKSALEILEEQKRGKELRAVDHTKIEYISFRKNLYIVPRVLSRLTEEQVKDKRDDLQIKVRGRGCPAPVDTWDQCGFSERILQLIQKHNLMAPFAIQKQALPAIMCGRDVIGVAKTGSGKTLAFLLPMLRHIQDQPPLRDGEGPIGLIMAPARELAFQINNEAKKFARPLGLRVACIYGGAGVAEQIADLKRGAEIVVCTPGRMIDILCMQAGKLISLKRVTMVVMDEADR
jgi:ATP-dependent RNA helicase DDX46/PRP5